MSVKGRVAIYVVIWAEQRYSKNSGQARFVRKSEAEDFAASISTIYSRVRVIRELVSPEFRERVTKVPILLRGS